VLINTTQTNAETLGSLHEDLSVMSHLLDKLAFVGLRQGQDPMMGIVIPGFEGPRGSENLYIEGQGAILIRHVKFALLPRNTKENVEPAAKKDSAWDEAKSDLYGSRQQHVIHGPNRHRDFPAYDAEKVEALKREIVGALKYAANIRGLGTGESVTVVLLGAQDGNLNARHLNKSEANERGRDVKITVDAKVNFAVREAATMTIRVKKSDAESALKGSIDLGELQKRAVISVY
jgi:hypothetical protein